MTEALVQFVRARLNEDVHWALTTNLALEPETWEPDHENGVVLTVTGDRVATSSRQSVNDIEHIVRHDPARILREVAAKRLMLDEALASRHHISSDQYETCPRATEADGLDVRQVADLGCLNDEQRQEFGREPTCWDSCGRDARVHRTLELLALPYSDHPNYRQEWRP